MKKKNFNQKVQNWTFVQLQGQLKSLESEYDQLYKQKSAINQKIEDTATKIGKVKAKLIEKPPEIVISDHAVMRYLERVTGIDMKMIRDAICPPHLKEEFSKFQNGEFPIGDGVVAVLDNYTVVTIK